MAVRPHVEFPEITLSKETLARIRGLKDLHKDSDRAVAIVCAAYVDEDLADCIRRHFIQSNSEYRDRIGWLMQSSNPLGAFGTRIDLGWVMGIYDRAAYSDLKQINRIRNEFAHKVQVHSFDDEEVSKKCDSLRLVDSFLDLTPDTYEFLLEFRDGTPIEARMGPRRDGKHPFWQNRREHYWFTCATLAQLLRKTRGRHHVPLF